MTEAIQTIPVSSLMIAIVPVLGVIFLIQKWNGEGGESLYAMSRMLIQLLIIGYFLTFLFDSDGVLLVSAVIVVMITVSSWIALRTVKMRRKDLYKQTLVAIFVGASIPLIVITQLVLDLEPFYSARQVIPLAGMIVANAMNSVSIAAERVNSEIDAQRSFVDARSLAFKAALIPITNSLFAVGLVSLPGMMTGQILSGVDPLIATRYQIMVMCMLFSSAGISSALFLVLIQNKFEVDSTA